MTRADVTAALEASGTSFRSFQRWPNTPDIIAIEGSAFQVFFDADDRVESIELSGTPNGDRVSGSEPRLIASIEGVDVFRTTAVDVVEGAGGFRTPIPIDSVHPFRSFRTPRGGGRVALM